MGFVAFLRLVGEGVCRSARTVFPVVCGGCAVLSRFNRERSFLLESDGLAFGRLLRLCDFELLLCDALAVGFGLVCRDFGVRALVCACQAGMRAACFALFRDSGRGDSMRGGDYAVLFFVSLFA